METLAIISFVAGVVIGGGSVGLFMYAFASEISSHFHYQAAKEKMQQEEILPTFDEPSESELAKDAGIDTTTIPIAEPVEEIDYNDEDAFLKDPDFWKYR